MSLVAFLLPVGRKILFSFAESKNNNITACLFIEYEVASKSSLVLTVKVEEETCHKHEVGGYLTAPNRPCDQVKPHLLTALPVGGAMLAVKQKGCSTYGSGGNATDLNQKMGISQNVELLTAPPIVTISQRSVGLIDQSVVWCHAIL